MGTAAHFSAHHIIGLKWECRGLRQVKYAKKGAAGCPKTCHSEAEPKNLRIHICLEQEILHFVQNDNTRIFGFRTACCPYFRMSAATKTESDSSLLFNMVAYKTESLPCDEKLTQFINLYPGGPERVYPPKW